MLEVESNNLESRYRAMDCSKIQHLPKLVAKTLNNPL